MALSPTIPTSFVPRPGAPRRFNSDFAGAFSFLAYTVLGIVFLLALGVFIYGQVLATEKTSKDNELSAAVAAIDPNTAESFIRLSNRLVSSKTLLDEHIAFSNVFSLLEKIMPATVRFTSLHMFVDSTGTSNLEGAGTAKSFNALAAASAAFAADGNIKGAIFSNIKVNKDNSVSFMLAATLDPKIVTFSP